MELAESVNPVYINKEKVKKPLADPSKTAKNFATVKVKNNSLLAHRAATQKASAADMSSDIEMDPKLYSSDIALEKKAY